MKEENFVSIICYYHNYYDKSKNFIEYISNFVINNFKRYELIIVCDETNDQKRNELTKIVKNITNDIQISIIYLEHYYGKNRALSAAIDLSIGDYIIEFDDINHIINEDKILDIYRECLNGNDACILVQKKISISDKLYYSIIKKFSYAKYTEYREDGILSVVSRRMLNRIGSLKKQVTNKWFYYKLSGLSCKYIQDESNKKVSMKFIEKTKERVNTIFVFTSLFIDVFAYISIFSLIISISLLLFVGLTDAILGMILSMIMFGLIYIMKKQSLSLEYLWSDTNYQFSSIEKISKE